MKILVAAALLLALSSSAHAETCTGRVTIHVVTDNGGLNPKGTKELSVGDCHTEQNERVLRTCPKGSFCRVEGTRGGDEALEITSVTRVDPYKEGMRDYREGLCFRARPYIDHGPEQDLWIKGYRAHQTTKIGKRNDEHCFLRNAVKEKH